MYNPLVNFLEGKPCEAFGAPFDVLFPEGDEADVEGELREEEWEFGPIESRILPGFAIEPEKLFAEQ